MTTSETCDCLDPVVFGHHHDPEPPTYHAGKTFTRRGYPYQCGDGDGDGYDSIGNTIYNATLYIGGQAIGITTVPIEIRYTP